MHWTCIDKIHGVMHAKACRANWNKKVKKYRWKVNYIRLGYYSYGATGSREKLEEKNENLKKKLLLYSKHYNLIL